MTQERHLGQIGHRRVQRDELASWGALVGTLPASKVSSSIPFLTPVNGSIIIGNTTPAWTTLAIGSSGTLPRSNGTTLAYSTFTIPDTYVQGDILYASAASVLTALAKNTTATRYLSNTGASNNPAWAQVNLTNGVTDVLPLANGGTNAALTASAGGVIYSTASALALSAVGTSGQFLRSGGTGAPTWFDLFGTTNTWTLAQTFSAAPLFSTMTAGSVLFAGAAGLLSQDNANFFWDDTNNRLGIGTTVPTRDIHVKRTDTTQALIDCENSNSASMATIVVSNNVSNFFIRAIGTTEATTGAAGFGQFRTGSDMLGLVVETGVSGTSSRPIKYRPSAPGSATDSDNLFLLDKYPSGSYQALLTSLRTDKALLGIQAIASQTTNLMDWIASGGGVLSSVDISGNFTIPVGAVSTPGLYFLGDSDTGVYRPGANRFAVTAGGRQFIDCDNTTTTDPFVRVLSGVNATCYLALEPIGASAESILRVRKGTSVNPSRLDFWWGVTDVATDAVTAPSAGQDIGRIWFAAGDNAGTPNVTVYAQIIGEATIVTDGAERGSILMGVTINGTLTNVAQVNATGVEVLSGYFSDALTDGSTGGYRAGASSDVLLFRGAADRWDIASGDSLYLVSGGLGVGTVPTGTAGSIICSNGIAGGGGTFVAGALIFDRSTPSASTFIVTDADTTTVTAGVTSRHATSGTAAAGFGSEFLYSIEDDSGAFRNAGRIKVLWDTAASATRRAVIQWNAATNASDSVLGFEMRGTGTANKFNFAAMQSGATPNYQSMVGGWYFGNAGTAPAGNPASGGFMYATGGAGTWLGSSGTSTTFGPAGPHCGRCGADFWRSCFENKRWKAYLRECGWCGKVYRKGPRTFFRLLTRQQRREIIAA